MTFLVLVSDVWFIHPLGNVTFARDEWTKYIKGSPFSKIFTRYTKSAINHKLMSGTWYVWVRRFPTAQRLKTNVIQRCHLHETWRMKKLISRLNSVIFNPYLSEADENLLQNWQKGETNCLWGKNRNLFPQFVLISPCRVYFNLTHEQILAHMWWSGKTQMKDACWTTGCNWDLCSLSDSEDYLSFTSLCAST